DRATWKVYRTMHCGTDGGLQLGFNQKGDRVAVVGWGGLPKLFDVGTGQKLFSATGYAVPRFSRDDRSLAGSGDGRVGFWQVGDSREYRKLVHQSAPDAAHRCVALHPEGRLVAAGMEGGIGLWDLITGSELAFVPINDTREIWELRFE